MLAQVFAGYDVATPAIVRSGGREPVRTAQLVLTRAWQMSRLAFSRFCRPGEMLRLQMLPPGGRVHPAQCSQTSAFY